MTIHKLEELQPFSEKPVCVKCGGENISRQYHPKDVCRYGCNIFGNWIEFEHHAMHCRTCTFKWQEQVR